MIYQMQEGYLTLEGEWQDQSMNVLVPEDMATKGVNLVVARDTMPMGVAFADYINQQKQVFVEELPGYTLLADTQGEIDGHVAHFFEHTWENEGKPVHQVMAVMFQENHVLNLTGTIPGGIDHDTAEKLLFIMNGFRFGITEVNVQ